MTIRNQDTRRAAQQIILQVRKGARRQKPRCSLMWPGHLTRNSGRYNLFEACQVRPRLNAPGTLSSPGGSHVSLLRYVQFPVQSAKFPVSILREFGGNTLNLFANGRAASPITGLKRQNFPVFSRETGNSETETGSPMTASTAS